MSTTPEATSYHSSRKFSILLPLRAIKNFSFHYETPCINLYTGPIYNVIQTSNYKKNYIGFVFNALSDNSKIKKLALPFIHYEIITMLAFGWQHHCSAYFEYVCKEFFNFFELEQGGVLTRLKNLAQPYHRSGSMINSRVPPFF